MKETKEIGNLLKRNIGGKSDLEKNWKMRTIRVGLKLFKDRRERIVSKRKLKFFFRETRFF